jgi:hypothetical protein
VQVDVIKKDSMDMSGTMTPEEMAMMKKDDMMKKDEMTTKDDVMKKDLMQKTP